MLGNVNTKIYTYIYLYICRFLQTFTSQHYDPPKAGYLSLH